MSRPGVPTTTLSSNFRRQALERAAEGVRDLVVVGGGITGAGTAREAALADMDTLLVDKGDFAGGTSSRSSKLIHGGVRYLAQGDVALVREAARERAVLRKLAPHLATPARMMMPVASRAGRMKMAAGLWTFERLAGESAEDKHDTLGRDDTMAREPGLRAASVAGSVCFTEFVTDDARLTLENVRSAAGSGALVANYAGVTAIREDGDNLVVDVRDAVTDETFSVRTRALVNAAGPWFDSVRGLADPNAGATVQLTRGIHLVVPIEKLPVRHIVVLRSPDGRPTFVVPRGDVAYIGTTDTHYEGEPDEPGIGAADVAYLLESVAATFEDAPTPADIVGAWSGVRPLLKQEGKSPSEISRRDEIMTGPGPIVAVAGGKLTTYRRMGERVVAEVARMIGREAPRSVSADRALVGGSAEDQARARRASTGIGDSALEDRLWGTYGVGAADLIALIAADPSAAEPIGGLPCLTRAEVEYAVDSELALSVDDVLRRRSRAGLFDTERAAAAADAVAALMAERLGWSLEETERQSERSKRLYRDAIDSVRGATPRAA